MRGAEPETAVARRANDLSPPISPPTDTYSLVWVVFFAQGVGMNLPWNVFITAVLYFHTRLAGTPFQDNFENIFSVCYSSANLVFMTVVVLLGGNPCFTMRSSVAMPQTLTALIFAATTAMVELTVDGTLFFAITATFVLVCGITAALIQAGIFGLAGRFPPVYTQAVMSGQGVAGVIVSVTSLISALSSSCDGKPGDPSTASVRPESFAYFLTSSVVVILTLLAFLALTGSDFAQFYAFGPDAGNDADNNRRPVGDSPPATIADSIEDAMFSAEAFARLTPNTQKRVLRRRQSILASPVFQRSSSSGDGGGSGGGRGSRYRASHRQGIRQGRGHTASTRSPSVATTASPLSSHASVSGSDDNESPATPPLHRLVTLREEDQLEAGGISHIGEAQYEDADENDDDNGNEIGTCALICRIGRHCFSVCLVFAVTLSVFPGITSEVRSEHNLNNAKCPNAGRFPYGAGVWQALFFLIFNSGDTLGRLLAGLGQLVSARNVVWLSVVRAAFVPLFLMCNVAAKTSDTASTSFFFSPDNGIAAGASNGTTLLLHTDDLSTVGTPWHSGFFAHDYWPFIFITLMSISNGYVASLEMMNAPRLAPDGQQSRAGTIMAFFLVLGLVLGSLLSFGVRAIACQCNPFVAHP